MIVEKTKLLNFENLILNEAREKRDVVFDKLKLEKKEKVDEIVGEISQKSGEIILNETFKIKREKNKRIIHKQIENKQELLNERERLIDNVFESVLIKLKEYTSTDEYSNALITTIKNEKQKLGDTTVVILSEMDRKLEKNILELGVVVEFTTDNFVGGCLIVDRKSNIQIDETYSSKLAVARDTFLETYNIKV